VRLPGRDCSRGGLCRGWAGNVNSKASVVDRNWICNGKTIIGGLGGSTRGCCDFGVHCNAARQVNQAVRLCDIRRVRKDSGACAQLIKVKRDCRIAGFRLQDVSKRTFGRRPIGR
jgi:hypothetical protein